MAKQKKTAAEIEAIIMQAAAKVTECDGMTGVNIQPIDDDRVSYNWTVSQINNNTSDLCAVAVAKMVEGAQLVIDLD